MPHLDGRKLPISIQKETSEIIVDLKGVEERIYFLSIITQCRLVKNRDRLCERSAAILSTLNTLNIEIAS